MGLELRVNKRGYYLYNNYTTIYEKIMFSKRYRNVNNKLLKRYIAYQYVLLVTGKIGERYEAKKHRQKNI